MVTEKQRKIVLPPKYWEEFAFYIEKDPQPDYVHAPVEAHEAFRDMKFGVRIHWGIYSVWELQGESWPYLKMNKQKRQTYQEL
jgi:alpha-L-fucosidase